MEGKNIRIGEATGLHPMSGYYKLMKKKEIKIISSSPAGEPIHGLKEINYKRYNPTISSWMPVRGGKRSSLFPYSWDWSKIRKEIKIAYENARFNIPGEPPKYWQGKCSQGFDIGGYMLGDKINTAFPVLEMEDTIRKADIESRRRR